MSNTITITHISDLHLGPLPALTPRHWNLKRALGYLNWQRKRRALHRAEAWQAVLAEIRRLAPDHVAITGDLINIGLPAEYEAARRWLDAIGSPDRVSLVPGNHDIYCRLATDHGIGRWRGYMTGDDAGRTSLGANREPIFPFLRRIGPVALVGLNSAVPTAVGSARGTLGPDQLSRLGEILQATRRDGLFRCVLIHHPPLVGQSPPARALTDAKALSEVLRCHGVELVLHGHNHLDEFVELATATGPAAIVGVGSASMIRPHGAEPAARLALYRITAGRDRWRVTLERRGLVGGPFRMTMVERRDLQLGAIGALKIV